MTDNLKASIIELNFLNISLLTYYVCCFSCPVLSERANQRVTQQDGGGIFVMNNWMFLKDQNHFYVGIIFR